MVQALYQALQISVSLGIAESLSEIQSIKEQRLVDNGLLPAHVSAICKNHYDTVTEFAFPPPGASTEYTKRV